MRIGLRTRQRRQHYSPPLVLAAAIYAPYAILSIRPTASRVDRCDALISTVQFENLTLWGDRARSRVREGEGTRPSYTLTRARGGGVGSSGALRRASSHFRGLKDSGSATFRRLLTAPTCSHFHSPSHTRESRPDYLTSNDTARQRSEPAYVVLKAASSVSVIFLTGTNLNLAL